MSDVMLGKAPTALDKRDAIHVLVLPMTAQGHVVPGIGVSKTGSLDPKNFVAVADPFFSGVIPHGQRFWALVKPGYGITARHTWSHPDFPDEQADPTPSEKLRHSAAVLDIQNLELSNEVGRLREKIEELEEQLKAEKRRADQAEEDAGDPACRGCY